MRSGESLTLALILLAGGALTAAVVWKQLQRAQRARARAREFARLAQSLRIEARFWWLTEEHPGPSTLATVSVKVVNAAQRIAVTQGRIIEVTSVARPAGRTARSRTVGTQTRPGTPVPFPPIRWCVMAEDVRVEENRRQVSLIGFYGVTPHVDIPIRDFAQPLERLAFYLWTQGEGDGRRHTLTFQVLDPDQKTIIG